MKVAGSNIIYTIIILESWNWTGKLESLWPVWPLGSWSKQKSTKISNVKVERYTLSLLKLRFFFLGISKILRRGFRFYENVIPGIRN